MAQHEAHEVPAHIAHLLGGMGINPDDVKIRVLHDDDINDYLQEDEQHEDNFKPFKERINMKPFFDNLADGLASVLSADERAVKVNSDAAYEYRDGDDLTIVFDAPGLDEDTIKVTYDEAGITVSGERFFPGTEADSNIEILYSNVETELELFHGLEIEDPEKLDVNFDYENGSITVTLVGFSAAPKVYEAARKSATKKADTEK